MRKGFLKPVMALLAGAGLAVCQPSALLAAGKVTQVSFEDSEQTVTSDGKVAPKPLETGTVIEGAPMPHTTVFGGGGPVGDYGGGSYGGGNGADANRFWVSGEYLLWWLKSAGGPPLITFGAAADAVPGGLGQPGTTVIVSSPTLSDHARSGARFTAGLWLDCDHTLGFETSYFFFPTQTKTVVVASSATGAPVIARPLQDATTGREDAELDALPGVLSGGKVVQSKQFFDGVEANGLLNLTGCNECFRFGLLGGFRWLQLNESIGVIENTTVLPGIATVLPAETFPFMPGNRIVVADQFSTRSNFYGGQIGADAEWRRGNFTLDVFGKVALGDTHNVVDINGLTRITTPAGVVTNRLGGLLALSSNIGRHTQDKFSAVPEIGFNVGYNVTQRVRLFAGYEFLYWSDVVRPGDQIDRVINPNLVPTSTTFNPASAPALPRFAFHNTDFWAQGFNFGIEFDY